MKRGSSPQHRLGNTFELPVTLEQRKLPEKLFASAREGTGAIGYFPPVKGKFRWVLGSVEGCISCWHITCDIKRGIREGRRELRRPVRRTSQMRLLLPKVIQDETPYYIYKNGSLTSLARIPNMKSQYTTSTLNAPRATNIVKVARPSHRSVRSLKTNTSGSIRDCKNTFLKPCCGTSAFSDGSEESRGILLLGIRVSFKMKTA